MTYRLAIQNVCWEIAVVLYCLEHKYAIGMKLLLGCSNFKYSLCLKTVTLHFAFIIKIDLLALAYCLLDYFSVFSYNLFYQESSS